MFGLILTDFSHLFCIRQSFTCAGIQHLFITIRIKFVVYLNLRPFNGRFGTIFLTILLTQHERLLWRAAAINHDSGNRLTLIERRGHALLESLIGHLLHLFLVVLLLFLDLLLVFLLVPGGSVRLGEFATSDHFHLANHVG